MGKCSLSIDVSNAAFEADPQSEVCRILRYLADRIEQQSSLEDCNAFCLCDSNGNTVGRFSVTKFGS